MKEIRSWCGQGRHLWLLTGGDGDYLGDVHHNLLGKYTAWSDQVLLGEFSSLQEAKRVVELFQTPEGRLALLERTLDED